MQFLFVCMSVFLSFCLSVCHLKSMSHKGHVTVAVHHIGKVSQWQLVGQKTRTLMSGNCREGSLRNKNTHLICCVKKLRMTQAQSLRAHTPGGFKLFWLCSARSLNEQQHVLNTSQICCFHQSSVAIKRLALLISCQTHLFLRMVNDG